MNIDPYVVCFVPGDLFFFPTCSSGTSLERREWPLFHGKPDKKSKTLKPNTEKQSVENMKTVLFTYFYKELGAFGHEYEDEG